MSTVHTPTLVDVQKNHAEDPATFEAPAISEVRLALAAGSFVKVCAEFKPAVKGFEREGSWLDVVGVYDGPSGTSEPDVVWVGRVDNDLLFAPELGFDYGDLIAFTPMHVLDLVAPQEGR